MAIGKPQVKPPISSTDVTTRVSTDAEVLAASRKSTRRSFAVAALGAAAGIGFCRWVFDSPPDGMQPWPKRRLFQANAKIAQAIFEERALAPTYARSRVEQLRINGLIGLKHAIAPESWRLQVVGVAEPTTFPQYVPDVTAWEYAYGSDTVNEGDHFASIPADPILRVSSMFRERTGKRKRGLEEAGPSRSTLPEDTPGLLLTVTDLLKLPKQELVTEFKCVEGWSQITQWGGVRMADFLEAYPPARKPDGSLPRYVYMETPNGDYYIGYDMAVCRHPQTLLVTEIGRGRDGPFGPPPAQTRAGAANAHGSCLGCWDVGVEAHVSLQLHAHAPARLARSPGSVSGTSLALACFPWPAAFPPQPPPAISRFCSAASQVLRRCTTPRRRS